MKKTFTPTSAAFLPLWVSFILFCFISCKEETKSLQKEHDPSQPISLTSFYPTEGGAKDKILLNGDNFGTDPSKITVTFNNKEAAVVSSSGNRIYAIVPRLPGDNPTITVKIGDKTATYEHTFDYKTQAQVSTVVGTGTRQFIPGTLDQASVCAKYLEIDAEDNLFMTWRDGPEGDPARYGVARLNEAQNIVTPLYQATTGPYPYANGLAIDRSTGVVTVSHESVVEAFFSFDPKEGWYMRQRNATFPAGPHGIPSGDQYMNFVSFCPYDGYLYTRARIGTVVRINPNTYESSIVQVGAKGNSKWPYGSQYGQAINPKRPWELWMTLTTNGDPVEFRQGLMMLDLRNINEGFKRVNAVGGSAHRDGPIAEALFNDPKEIKFDNDGNMFVADYGNHCIRMVSPDGIVTTVAGQPGVKGYKDGGPIESLFNNPWGVAINERGDIYIADYGNNRIRKLVIE